MLALGACGPSPRAATRTPASWRDGTDPGAAATSPAATGSAGPPGGAPVHDPATAVAWLAIPTLGLAAVPIYDRGLDGAHQMEIAPGWAVTHYALSAPLGGPGNAVLYGHDDIEGSVFARLARLRPGDGVQLRLASGRVLTYAVARPPALVAPSDIAILAATPSPQLTLFSCYPVNVDNQRVVVVATPSAQG